MAQMEPSPGPAGPRATEGTEPEPESAGVPWSACPFLAWSAAEVAEWVAQLGFPQYEVRDCRPGREAPVLTAASTGGPELCVCVSVCDGRGSGP